MIENGLFLTGSDAELLSRALSEVKAKFYEESETSLDDTQALDALLSSLRTVETEEREKKSRQAYLSPLGKRLMLGKIIGRQGDADSRESASR
jgi:ATP-dependent exoDNAse (exonuclease V) beta subunit